MTRQNEEAPIVPPTAFVNINHLGLSTQDRFDAKQALIKGLAARNRIVGIQELHCSSARAQSLFFDHFVSHVALFNNPDGAPGQVMLLSRSWLETANLSVDSLHSHHCVIVPGVAHAFWLQIGDTILCVCNLYLDAHDAQARVEQMRLMRNFVEQFRVDHPASDHVFIVGGDRNFVVKPEQHNSSRGTSWWPGGPTMAAWSDLMSSMEHVSDTELDEHTWTKRLRSSDGQTHWIHRTIDFATVSMDPVRHLDVNVNASMYRGEPGRKPSDHMAVELRGSVRHPPNCRRRSRARAPYGVPEWLCDNHEFSIEFEKSVQEWLMHRRRGLFALGEFVDMAQAFGKEWLTERIVEATCVEHKFDVCMVVQSHAVHNVSIPMRKVSRWCAVYPALRDLVGFHIDAGSSSVWVESTDRFVQHVHDLASEVAELRMQRDSNDNDVSAGATLRNNAPHASAVDEIKRLTAQSRSKIVSLWNEERTERTDDPAEIGEAIRAAGERRSGTPRGTQDHGDSMLSKCTIDLSQCRSRLSTTEIMQLLLSIHDGKRPGSTGVCGKLYKRHALALAPVFMEAFEQLQGEELDMAAIPPHLRDGLWVPIAKREGADTLDAIRDLEIPNEDLKIIERMIFKIIDEIASSQILPLNQAFVKGGDIMHNVFSLHTAMQAYAGSDNLKLFLLMDCTKGFNLVSHVWTARVLDKMGLPAGLRRMVERLLSIQRGILSFGGMRHHPIEWKCGFRQGGPLSAMLFVLVADPFLESLVGLEGVEDGFGFCDDWQAIMSDIASASSVRRLVEEFELVSGLMIHRTKTVWLTTRPLNAAEAAQLRAAWPGANLVDKQTVLGTPLGRHVPITEFCAKPLRTLFERIAVYRKLKLSLGMRMLVANTFLLPCFSYVGRIVLIPPETQREVSNAVFRYITPVPFCKLELFAHARSIFKVPFEVKDLMLDNVAGLLSTALRLQQDRNRWGRLMREWDHVLTWGSDRPSCPMTSVATAYLFFRSQVGETFESFSNRIAPFGVDDGSKPKPHAACYRAMLRAGEERVRADLTQRFQSKGFDEQKIFANLKKMPSSIPSGHRLFMFRLLCNGLPTTRRMRFVTGEPEKQCCFCGADGSDSQYHWPSCSKLNEICGRIYGAEAVSDVITGDALMLQREEDGHSLQRMLSFWCAVWKVRGVLHRGLRHPDDNDLLHHFQCIIDDPWLIGHPSTRTRAERRSSRICPPEALRDWHVYNSDGASRSQTGEPRKASFGVELAINQAVIARRAVYLGDKTNNEAEYGGILEALRHALVVRPSRACFRVDSKLACEQLCGRWACRAHDLIPLYEACHDVIRDLKALLGYANVRIEHVYREFNAGADGLANYAIDDYDGSSPVVISENWSPHAAAV